ncbi:MAG: hypothetical protein GWN99_10715 [Gemmatimonadetes bacterium]|uniref:Uncharacterized protein n=1 Tax=Candidatus Kutchimonas denitrificans TaxID=3056748 RepID=A0AAE4Z725_9BACT|nr:hypothetical protein [Gemmatimonadota bacterium]NIR74768.1 hypothetical protein [Candidatus Kutchimonas denitrificans]NIS01518.1 hypothetical protein [Gemmatimonadota bacterium]NIT67259.1 hypothetical protein [Gemmatimonadota bacterium]NIU52433.1 hypothetical protein [Gemmatimonadota bacterium]
MRKVVLFMTLAAVAADLSACGSASRSGISMPRNVPVPEDAENPIVMTFEGATLEQLVGVIAQALSSQGIPTYQVVPEDGIVETQWLDMAIWDPTRQAANLPVNERTVLLYYGAGAWVDPETDEELENALVAWAYYQPNPELARVRPRTYREEVPTTHYGYSFLLRVQSVINAMLSQEGIDFEMVEPSSLGG